MIIPCFQWFAGVLFVEIVKLFTKINENFYSRLKNGIFDVPIIFVFIVNCD